MFSAEDGMKKRIVVVFLTCMTTLAHAGPFSNVMGALAGGASDEGPSRSLDRTLENVSAHMNRMTPVTLDADTRLDSVSAGPGHRLSYHYTLTSIQSKDIKRAEFQKLIRAPLQARLCESPEMSGFLKHGVTISYIYRSADGRNLGGAQFSPSDCGYQKVS
jgi:hypothetical protein